MGSALVEDSGSGSKHPRKYGCESYKCSSVSVKTVLQHLKWFCYGVICWIEAISPVALYSGHIALKGLH